MEINKIEKIDRTPGEPVIESIADKVDEIVDYINNRISTIEQIKEI